MPVVVDASAIAGALIPDEDASFAESVLRAAARDSGLVPALFWSEVRNLLIISERRGRLKPENTLQVLDVVRLSALSVAHDPADTAIFDMCRTQGLSAYDATYAAIAIRENAPLATLDKKLIAAGEAGAFALWHPPGHKDGGGDGG